jgi:hypothetical protein
MAEKVEVTLASGKTVFLELGADSAQKVATDLRGDQHGGWWAEEGGKNKGWVRVAAIIRIEITGQPDDPAAAQRAQIDALRRKEGLPPLDDRPSDDITPHLSQPTND